jgi:hypothetical protein
MRILFVVFLFSISLFSQQLVYELKMDTTQYMNPDIGIICVQIPGAQGIQYNGLGGKDFVSTSFRAIVWKKLNSDQYDIFSYSGKVGSVTIPQSLELEFGGYALISQTIVDNDNGWEYIANLNRNFKVIDDNGTVMLADSGFAFYGYDGQNTYVGSNWNSLKIWKFRSNINASNPPVAKSTTSAPAPMMILGEQGDFRVTLEASKNGQTTFQIFDMLGRQVYCKFIQENKLKTSFIIPSQVIPNSPFVARVINSDGTYIKKEVPIH